MEDLEWKVILSTIRDAKEDIKDYVLKTSRFTAHNEGLYQVVTTGASTARTILAEENKTYLGDVVEEIIIEQCQLLYTVLESQVNADGKLLPILSIGGIKRHLKTFRENEKDMKEMLKKKPSTYEFMDFLRERAIQMYDSYITLSDEESSRPKKILDLFLSSNLMMVYCLLDYTMEE